MTNAIQRPRNPQTALWFLLLGSAACNADPSDPADTGTPMMVGSGGAVATGGTTAAGTGGTGPGGTGSGGTPGSNIIDAGHPPQKLDAGAPPKLDAGHPDASLVDAAAPEDPIAYAAGLDQLFIDVPCDAATPSPPPNMATCQHPPNTQHIEKMVTFGGDPTVIYVVKLRVRGIWEPTSIAGGQRPMMDNPLTLGGTVAVGTGDPINYQQYYIKVAAPAQTYWLNDYQYVAHDIHKEDYEATLRITGGSNVTVVMNDGNDHQIANWTEDYFEGLAPYATAPSTGQLLRLDVESVIIAPQPEP